MLYSTTKKWLSNSSNRTILISVVETVHSGLTTNDAPFIDEARVQGRCFIHQPYELYSDENHETWRRLYERMLPRWRQFGNTHFLDGIDSLCLDPQNSASGRRQQVPSSADRISGQGGCGLRAGICVFRLPAEPRISHHHHHSLSRSEEHT